MSILSLVQLKKNKFRTKETLLREESKEVDDFGDDFQSFINDLVETFYQHKIAVGLSAPQVGVQLKVSVINPNKHDKPDDTLIIVNPKILSTSGQKDKKKEACMSLPHYQGEVVRRTKIAISYQDRFGKKHVLETKGFLARIIAHEIDHLEGYLYIDRMVENVELEPAEFFSKD
ncbi:peptide deformylase [Candidatus Parcubacteria bacterium]|nr:peptide deformylase [Candidatus Parcubacteria bacterium]